MSPNEPREQPRPDEPEKEREFELDNPRPDSNVQADEERQADESPAQREPSRGAEDESERRSAPGATEGGQRACP